MVKQYAIPSKLSHNTCSKTNDQRHDQNVEIFEKETKLEFENNQVVNNVLKTTKLQCSICKVGDLKPEGKPTPIVVYGRDGANVHPHQYTRCRFRAGTGHMKVACRASYSLGSKNYRGMRIYEDDAL